MINVVHQNLFSLDVDAIVNSANISLLAGSGICEVIHKNTGKEIEAYCKTMGKQEYGNAVITLSFNLAPVYDHIIHACGPRYLDGQRDSLVILLLEMGVLQSQSLSTIVALVLQVVL